MARPPVSGKGGEEIKQDESDGLRTPCSPRLTGQTSIYGLGESVPKCDPNAFSTAGAVKLLEQRRLLFRSPRRGCCFPAPTFAHVKTVH